MTGRNHRTARDAGSRHERQVADALAKYVNPDIDRRVRTGGHRGDRGDIRGLKHMGGELVVECKSTSKVEIGQFLTEAETERGNADALAGLAVAKRRGHGDVLDSVVLMTLRDLIAIVTGERPA